MDDSFESPNAKYIHEIYSDKNELEMLEADFVNIADSIDNWLKAMDIIKT
jgi:hypothetical protein